MMDEDDILDHEIERLGRIIETGKLSFFKRLTHSKPALFAIALMVFLFQMRNLPEILANSSLDAAIVVQRPSPAKSARLVAIDDQDYATMFHSRSPLDPEALGKILAAVAQGNPQAIVVDLDTADASFQSLQVPAVPTVWNVAGVEQPDGKFTIDAPLGGKPLMPGSVSALAAAPRDDRGIVRGYQHSYPLESGGSVDSPGYAAARIVEGHAPVEPASHAGETHFLDYRYRFLPVKARDLLENAASPNWAKMGMFSGQVVVVGGTYRVARDTYTTPKGLLDGCEILAQAIAAEIDGTFISPASRFLTGLLMILGGLATLAVYHWLKFRTAFIVSIVLVPVLSLASNWILFHRFAAWGAMVPLVIAVIVAELYSKATLYLTFYQKVSKMRTKETANDHIAGAGREAPDSILD